MSELHPPIDVSNTQIKSGIVVADINFNILQIDHICESLFGYREAELIQTYIAYLIKDSYRNNFLKSLENIRKSQKNENFETVVVTKQGKEFYAEFSVLWIDSDDTHLCICTVHNSSLQKLMMMAEQTDDSMTRAILDASLDCIVSIDSEGKFLEFNRAAELTFGYLRKDVIGKSMADYILPESLRDAHHIGLQRYLDTHEAKVLNQRLELMGRRADGTEFPIEITIVPIKKDNGELIFSAYLRDIAQVHKTRVRWERLLRFEEINREIIRLFLQLDNVDDVVNEVLAMTGALLDVSRAYVFRFREGERILDNTHEWCALGVKPEIDNLKGLPFDDLVPSFFPLIAQHDLIAPNHIRELPKDLRDILEPQDIQSVLWMPMYLHNRIEGFVGYDEVRASREWLPEEITMARIIMESYSRALERKQSEKMLVKARDEAIRTAQVRSQFVANMSHEIRTPMTGIMGMLELLLETDLDDIQQEFASEAFNSSTRLLSIINDILDFSKLDAGQIILEASEIDLRAIATEVKMTLAPQLKNKAVEIHVDIGADVPYRVHGDSTRLRQVLMNLAGNAIKFTHQGQVVIKIAVLTKNIKAAHLRFSVEDTGIGLAADKIHQIFDSFIQADGTTTRKYGGTGLGLSISKQLVELMGSVIEVDSQQGEGSVFRFDLALPIAQEESSQNADPGLFSDLSAIIVDDNQTSRYLLTQQLENWGIHVVAANNFTDLATIEPLKTADVIFVRYRQPINQTDLRLLDDQYEKLPRIFIVDEHMIPESSTELYLKWPIEASLLYNTLIGFTQTSTKQDDTPILEAIAGRILVADDYRDNRDIINGALSSLGVEIDFVTNGQEALDRLEKAHYDIVLMDIQMPVMGGIEATKHIRQSTAPYRDIPILAITASIMRHEQEHYLSIGVNKVIGKPFSIQELRSIVQEWLRKSQNTLMIPNDD